MNELVVNESVVVRERREDNASRGCRSWTLFLHCLIVDIAGAVCLVCKNGRLRWKSKKQAALAIQATAPRGRKEPRTKMLKFEMLAMNLHFKFVYMYLFS